MVSAQGSLRAATPPADQQVGCQENEDRGHQSLMDQSVLDHHLIEAEKIRPETWVPTARIAFIAGINLCQWWICIDEPRRGSGEWRKIPVLTEQEAESEGPVS